MEMAWTRIAFVTLLALGYTYASTEKFSCQPANLWNRTCFSNAQGRIGQFKTVDTARKCCGKCSQTTACKSWTWYQGTHCNLFKDVTGSNTGDSTCVSGTGAPAPSPSPAPTPCAFPPCIHSTCESWTPPPEKGPACKDCPNIIFSLTDDQVKASIFETHL